MGGFHWNESRGPWQGRNHAAPARGPFPVPHPRCTFPAVQKSSPLSLFPVLLALLVSGCGGHSSPSAAQPQNEVKHEPVRPLLTAAFAGQSVAVTPVTLVIAADSLATIAPLGNHAATLAWADSIVGSALTARGPEVKWVLPVELRRIARRAPTVAPDPDRMGQSILRAKLEDVPDPLRGNLRSLMALVGGRLVLVPAALSFLQEPDGQIRAELALAMADTRTGKVVWRTLAWAVGPTPARALSAALDTVLPVGLGFR